MQEEKMVKTLLKRVKIDPQVLYQFALHHAKDWFLCRKAGFQFVSRLEIGGADELGLDKNCPQGVMHVTRNVSGGISVVHSALDLDEINLLLVR